MTEHEMRDTEVETPNTKEELTATIEALVSQEHDYGTCVYAMSMAAVAAYNYVAHRLGVSGFQASCADLDIVRRTRMIDGPFMLITADKALYPQYDLQEMLAEAMTDWGPWLKEQAEKKITEDGDRAHPNVLAHWRALASATPQPSPQ